MSGRGRTPAQGGGGTAEPYGEHQAPAAQGLQDRYLYDYTFANDNGQNPLMKKARANALLDRDIPVLMTNFPTILNRLTGMFSEDRADFIASLGMYDLLIIDDLGVERNTEYAMEQMFTVIDCRYRSRKPMIITTNLKLEEIKNPPDLTHARIYDRILERCAPAPEDRPALVKKIGRTAYEVSFHFSTTSTETMSDKIKRLIKRDMSA